MPEDLSAFVLAIATREQKRLLLSFSGWEISPSDLGKTPQPEDAIPGIAVQKGRDSSAQGLPIAL